MKVDFYISSLSSGGAEHVLTNLAANFAEHDMDVSITSYEKRPQFYSVASNVKLNKYNFTNKSKLAEWLCDKKVSSEKKSSCCDFIFKQMQFYADSGRTFFKDKNYCLR